MVHANAQEADIGRIAIPDRGSRVCKIPISMEKSWAWWCVPVIPMKKGSIK
jgi:hypothetical protein